MAKNIDDTFLINRFPYATRLTSNDVPSDDEMEEIRTFLREPTEELQQMEVEIVSLQTRVNLLQRRHATLKKQIERCRSLITIPRRLPEDILLEIFFRCLPEIDSPELDVTSAPLLLTAICRRWRLLALQTPNLWSAIDLHALWMHNRMYNAGIRDTTEYINHMLFKWLERSGTCPFTFSLSSDMEAYQKIADACSDALLPFASRWKDVFLSGSFQSLSALFTIPSSEFQSLESLFLHFSDDKFPTDIPMLTAPHLRKVSIQSKAHGDPRTLTLPWARLTHLDLSTPLKGDFPAPDLYTLSAVLNQCTSLIHLGLNVDYCENVNPMYLPHLQRLLIRQPKPVAPQVLNASGLFAENLKAPLLRQISLRNFTREGFLAVLSNQGRSLQSLDLNVEYGIMIDAFADGLRHCPCLESLSILHLNMRQESFFSVDEDFFSLFAGSDETNTDPLCPLLQEIVLDRQWCDTLTGIVAFLEKKQSADPRVLSRLIKLSIDHLQEDGKSLSKATAIHALKPFIDKGLHFEMWEENRPYYFGGFKDWYYRRDSPSRFQYADCWRD